MDYSSTAYSTLPLQDLTGVTAISRPELRAAVASLDMDSPAITLLADFTKLRPQTIPNNAPASQALAVMKNSQVHMLLVINDQGHFTGIVSARLLFGGRAITVAMQHYNVDRDDVTVNMIQVKRDDLHALAYDRLQRATLGDLVQTLRSSGDRHILITEGQPGEESRIRGVISAADVSRALGIDLDHPPEAHSFSAIRSVVLGGDL
ncbi:CBS domain-containing protein [Phytohalomonas tamaricis]|uniref:CBS domain-containing protein n=1 Tax=Phytohalomonas tamaricis TaxID=2081032 RepID=UPI000D0BB452|nr:CBS domain-containing protein [Phytohalomonas tamaricis]